VCTTDNVVNEATTCTYQDRAERGKLVIQKSRLCDVASLECDLKAACSHPKRHGVHVDMVILGGSHPLSRVPVLGEVFPEGRRCLFVFEN